MLSSRVPLYIATVYVYKQSATYFTPSLCRYAHRVSDALHAKEHQVVVKLSLGKLLVNLLQVVKRTNTPLIPSQGTKWPCSPIPLFFVYFLNKYHFIFSSFWTSHDHRCRPFSSPGTYTPFFFAGRVQLSQLSSIPSDFATSRSRDLLKETRPTTVVHHFFLTTTPQFGSLRPLPKPIWRKIKLLPDEKIQRPRYTTTIRENKRGVFSDDFGLRRPSFRNQFRRKVLPLS